MIRALVLVALLAPAALAHDFWIEPGTRQLRVGEHFQGEPVRGSAPVLAVQRNGAVMLTYRSGTWATHTLSRAKFEQYLREEGVHGVQPTGDSQRERFTRFAKSHVRGDAAAIGPLGWRFEIVPLSPSRFRVDYEGAPLPNALVVALSRSGEKLSARTDAAGVVTLDLSAGAWLIKSVHVVPASPDSGVEWESLWASVTFAR
ncbi:MAG TPA: DUF4198 domain-containing protein [Thermoanaerobaculia bacterium]|nr:DUF4198 domain-containing protein [Thermoanaerobaculia bacterium]